VILKDFGMGLVAAAAVIASAAVAAPAPVGDLHLQYDFAEVGKPMPYRLYVPSSYDGSRAYPLVVVLHGSGSDENAPFERSDLRKIAEQRGYILVAPLGYSPFGAYGDFYPVVATREMVAQRDTIRKIASGGAASYPASTLPVEKPVAEDDYAEMAAANLVDPQTAALSEQDVMNVLARVRAAYRVDPKRIYLMGNSMGGIGALYLGARHPEVWAAMAPSGGQVAAWSYPYERLRDGHVALMLVHGDLDSHSNPASSRAIMEHAKAEGVDASLVVVKGGDHVHAWTMVLPQTFDFFDQHAKP
jgi:poly(3-hydroxybutyrate) depolymerase